MNETEDKTGKTGWVIMKSSRSWKENKERNKLRDEETVRTDNEEDKEKRSKRVNERRRIIKWSDKEKGLRMRKQ